MVSVVSAQIPSTMSYQGYLTDNSGNEVNGTHNFLFKIYEVETGGTAIWDENHLGVDVEKGVFNAILENLGTVAFDTQYWLGIIIDGGTELSPRIKLTSTPYSLNTGSIPDNIVTPEKINTDGAAANQSLVFDGSNLKWQTLTGGGLTLPYDGTYSGTGSTVFRLEASNTSNNFPTLILSNDGAGDCMQIENETGGNSIDIEHYGNNTAVNISNNGSGGSIWAEGNVEIQNDNDQSALYVVNDGTDYCAYFRISNFSSSSDAIYAQTVGSGYAGYFSGSINVTGNVDKSSSSVKIDNPLDPENKYLEHSTVSSPDMMNVYNGNIVLDNNGEVIVELPAWFETLNKEFRYQLTCIGGYAPVYIAEEISNNLFKISGGTSGMKISWQVTGIRQDPYANKNRIKVEVEKTAKEKGHYLHYKEYNQPIEKSIEVVKNPNLLEELKK